MTTDTIANIATALGLFATLITFVFNYRKEKKRETINFYRSISDKCNGLLGAITNDFGENDEINYYEAKTKNKIFNAIMGYLSLMEEFSVGINNKIFDLKIFKETAGSRSVKWYNRFEVLIYAIRKKNERKTIFKEFEKMVNEIDPTRKKLNEQELQEKLNKQGLKKEKEEKDLQEHLQQLQQKKEGVLDVQFNEIQIDPLGKGPVKGKQKYTDEEQKSIDALYLEGMNYIF